MTIKGISFDFFLLPHGRGETIGFRQGKFAYLIDCHDIPQDIVHYLQSKNLELLIIDCVCHSPHKTHLNTQKAFSFAKEINPRRARLIHMGHELDHEELEREALQVAELDITPLSDGQTLTYSKI